MHTIPGNDDADDSAIFLLKSHITSYLHLIYVTDKFGINTLYELSNSIAPTAEWKLKAWSRFLSKKKFPIFNIYNASDNVVQT